MSKNGEIEYDPFLLGFETEVSCPNRRELVDALRNAGVDAYISIDNYSSVAEYRWGVGTDGSVPNGVEIRSPINPSVEDIIKVFRVLPLMSRTWLTAGIHVHISHPYLPIAINLPTTSMWESRKEWVIEGRRISVEPTNDSSNCHYTTFSSSGSSDKYVPIRHISPNHKEVRVFNSSLSIRNILRNIRMVLGATKIIPKSEVGTTHSKASIRVIKRGGYRHFHVQDY